EGDDDRGDAQTYRIKVPGGPRGGEIVEEIDLHSILDALSDVPHDDRVQTLKTATIQAFEDEEATSAISRAIPISKWISAEVTIGPTRFFFRDGRWYEVGSGYVDHLRGRVAAILNAPGPVSLPAWNAVRASEKSPGVLDQLPQPGSVIIPVRVPGVEVLAGGG